MSIPIGTFSTIAAVAGAIVSLAEFKGWKRWVMVSLFIVLGGLEMAMIYNADAGHVKEVSDLRSQLDELQDKLTASLHTHLEINDPGPVLGDPYLPFRVGEVPNVRMSVSNAGEHVIKGGFIGYGLDVVPWPLQTNDEAQLWAHSAYTTRWQTSDH